MCAMRITLITRNAQFRHPNRDISDPGVDINDDFRGFVYFIGSVWRNEELMRRDRI